MQTPSIQTISILVGSTNPVKINAAKTAIEQYFPQAKVQCSGMHAPSLVPEQPMTEAQTRLGAINRARYCQQQALADFYVAIEGGVDNFEYGAATFAYMVILHKDKQSIGRSAQLPLPSNVYQALVAGEELGHVMDRLFNTDNIKQKGGAIGLLTQGLASREGNYTQALVLAMAPLINEDFFNDNPVAD